MLNWFEHEKALKPEGLSSLTILHSQWPKLSGNLTAKLLKLGYQYHKLCKAISDLANLSAIGLKIGNHITLEMNKAFLSFGHLF